jgi:hypothetical protein
VDVEVDERRFGHGESRITPALDVALAAARIGREDARPGQCDHAGMRTLPLVFTPTPHPLLALDDAQITLVAVQLQPSEVVVFLRAVVDDPQTEEDAYQRALDNWAAAGRHRHPPADPGERRFRHIRIALSDDIGGSYTVRQTLTGGSGRFFNAEWHFKGDVPDDARLLVVTAADEAGHRGSADIAL